MGFAQGKLSFLDVTAIELSTADLRGLSTRALEGANEPPLSLVVDILGYQVDVDWTTLANHTRPSLQGSEIGQQLFQRAGNGMVEIIPGARYSPPFPLPFGYYSLEMERPDLKQVGILSASEVYPEHQTLFPVVSAGSTGFDPGDATFGFYTSSPTHEAYSEDFWNKLLHPTNATHACRIYPLVDAAGYTIDNTFLLCFEEAQNGDYQDYIFVVKNIKPVKRDRPKNSTIVLDASAFLDEILRDHRIVDAAQIGLPWLYNNIRPSDDHQVQLSEAGNH